MSDENNTQITLPPGVRVQAGRETTQQNSLGQIVQGMNFPVTLPTGTVTNVFVPYTVLGNTELTQQLFDARIGAIASIPIG